MSMGPPQASVSRTSSSIGKIRRKPRAASATDPRSLVTQSPSRPP